MIYDLVLWNKICCINKWLYSLYLILPVYVSSAVNNWRQTHYFFRSSFRLLTQRDVISRYLLDENLHRYSSRKWELLKRFWRSELKGQGRCVQTCEYYNNGVTHLDSLASSPACLILANLLVVSCILLFILLADKMVMMMMMMMMLMMIGGICYSAGASGGRLDVRRRSSEHLQRRDPAVCSSLCQWTDHGWSLIEEYVPVCASGRTTADSWSRCMFQSVPVDGPRLIADRGVCSSLCQWMDQGW